MDLELVVENVNILSQQVSVLQEYIQLKFGSDFKEFHKFKESNPKLGMMVVVQGQSFSQDNEDDNTCDGEYADWDKGLTPRVTNVYKLEEEEVEQDFQQHQHPHNSYSHPAWNNNLHVEEVEEDPVGEAPEEAEDFYVDKPDESENCVEFSTEEIELLPSTSTSPPVLDWMGHTNSNGSLPNGHGNGGNISDTEPERRVIPPQRPRPIHRQIYQNQNPAQSRNVNLQVPGQMRNILAKKPRPRPRPRKMRPKFNLPTIQPSVEDKGPFRHAQYGLIYRMSDRGEKMVVNEYYFRMNKLDKKSGKMYWVCVDKTCPARLAQDSAGRPSMSREHSHPPPDPAEMRLHNMDDV